MIEFFVTIVLILFLLCLLGFIVLILLSAVFHLKYMVPFVPTPRRVIDTMVSVADLQPGQMVLDLGAGDGRILAAALRKEPGIVAVGYEGSLGVWLLARARNLVLAEKPDIRRENFFGRNFSDADVIFTYLSIDTMKKLLPKFQAELRPGTRVVSHGFSLRGKEPHTTHEVVMPFWGKTTVFEYRW